jgi:alpha-glucoside transport system substrate-binding protein
VKNLIAKFVIPILISTLALAALLGLLDAQVQAAEPDAPTQLVEVVGPFGGPDQENLRAVLEHFHSQTGISYTYRQEPDPIPFLLGCDDAGNCPDVAFVPNPGIVGDLVAQGDLVPIGGLLPDFDTYFNANWRRLSSVGSTLYAVPFRAADKSIIWYRPSAFDAVSATAPVSWTGLLDLSDQLVGAGLTPFSIGAESGPASGWPFTDQFENILLRLGGASVHDRLRRHEIPWTHPTVVSAFEHMEEILGQEAYQVGGISGTLSTNFMAAFQRVFSTPPSGTMHIVGTFARHWLPIGPQPVTDYDTFAFPEIDPAYGRPLLLGGDFAVAFNGSADTADLIAFLATPAAAEIWASGGGLSPNAGVDPAVYPDAVTRAWAARLSGAETSVFDLDDQLPSELQIYLWGAMMDFAAHPDQLTSILRDIETMATELQGLPLSVEKRPTPTGKVEPGDRITYTLTVWAAPGTKLGLYDQLMGTRFVRFIEQPDHVVYGDGAITGSLTITPGDHVTVSFVAQVEVPGTAGLGVTVTNRACIYPFGGTLGGCIWSNEVVHESFHPYRVFLPLLLR